MIKGLAQLFAVINANTRPVHVAAGVAWGLALALVPSGNLLWVLLFGLTFFLKINTTMQMLCLGLGKILVPIFQEGLHLLGYRFLTTAALKPVFTRLNNIPLVPFTRFNNTLVAGGVLAGLLSWLPCFFLALLLLRLYRRHLREKLVNHKLLKAFKQAPLIAGIYRAYRKTAGLSGEPESIG